VNHGFVNVRFYEHPKDNLSVTRKPTYEDLEQRIRVLEEESIIIKQAEESLRESEEKYRILLSESPDPTFSFTPEGQYRYVNRAFAEGVGKPVEDIIGKSIWDVFPKEEADMRFASLSQVFHTGKEQVIEVRVPRADGDRYYITTITLIKDTEGEILSAICSSKDITDRKLAEEALHRSEIKFRTLYDSTIDAVMLLEEKGFIDCNKATLSIFGCTTREEFCQKHPAILSPPQQPCGTDSIVLANQMIAEAMGRGSIHFEWMHKRNDTGETFPADVLLTAMEMDGKQVVQAVVRDITERKQAEEKSRNMLNLLQILINTIPSPIFRKDIHGRYQGCNKEFENYTGLRREEIIGKSVYDIYPKDVADKYHEMDLALFRELGRQIYEYPIIYADGERHDVVVNKATYFNADGTVGGLVGVMVDITKRKRMEEQLRESETKYRRLVETLNEGVWQIDKDGFTSFVNATMSEMLGYRTEEMLGKHLFEFMDERGVELAQYNIERRKHGIKERHDFELLHKDGTRIHVSISTTPIIDEEENYAGALAAVHDVTEIKEAAEELAKYRKGLERLVKERTNELRNKTKTLEEVNVALKVLLQHREEDKKELEDRVVMNVKNMIIPFAEKMKSTNLDDRQLAYMSIIATHLNDITSSMIKKMYQFNFTPTEVEVASLIKEGKATKEIARIIGIAASSVNTHRNNIRKKLGISKEKMNLHSHLQSFD